MTTPLPLKIVYEKEETQQEIAEKYNSELKWCIGQLETQLQNNKLSQKQVEQTMKTLKVLTNPKAPIVKKRMVMITVFGDYRKLMEDEDAKLEKAAKRMTVTDMRPALKMNGIFYKKCTSNEQKNIFVKSNNFRFNFEL